MKRKKRKKILFVYSILGGTFIGQETNICHVRNNKISFLLNLLLKLLPRLCVCLCLCVYVH